MKRLKFKGLLQNDGWVTPAFVSVNAEGKIVDISTKEGEEKVDEVINGYALPGFQNAHSHAFQYAMSGLAEIHPDPTLDDDFWSWRNTMYNIALSVDPEHVEAIASMLYSEMLRHGYTSVAEFHYLHHDKDGKPFSNKSELGERLIAAASKVGIKITLVPMFYQKGGFGKVPETNQRRFISPSVEEYGELLEASLKSTKHYAGANLGMGIHSLRAVEANDIKKAIENYGINRPIHFHVSEQLKEIQDCLTHLNARPVEWLLNNLELNNNYQLVHATHVNEYEVKGMANSNANVVLCPSTEGNLGDGLFPLKSFHNAGGKWSIGTDSHIGLNPFEELRILDYGQRLITHKRNQFISEDQGNTGYFAYDMSLKTGRLAMGNTSQMYFEVGSNLDAVVFKPDLPLLSSCGMDKILPTLVYSGDVSWVKGTMTQGKWMVKDQNHIYNQKVIEDFTKAIKAIGIRL